MVEHHHASFQLVASAERGLPTTSGHRGTFRGASPPNPLGFSRHDSGVPRPLEIARSFGKITGPGETESGSAGTQPDKGYPGRRCAHGTEGLWLKSWLGAALWRSPGTPELCLRKSILGPGKTFISTHRLSRGATIFRTLPASKIAPHSMAEPRAIP